MSKKFQDQLDELIRLQHDFVLIRKPREDAIHLHWDESVDGAEQFVFRNFDNSVHECWKQKERLTMDMNQFNFSIPLVLQENTVDEGIHHADYLTMIDETVEELQSRSAIEKIVMSRIQEESHDGIDLSASLKALHRRYPKAYVYLWHSLNHGTWIGASPELLLRAKNLTIETVSLAGTKAKDRGWTSKEIHEQQVVTDYITSTLAVAKPLKVDGPHTVDAGFFEHLKSYISAEIETRDQVETFLNALHPTPAVCGLPKEEAKAFILEHEGYNRKFYAGFMGWSNDYESEYFVNLRCAQLFSNKVKLYVGGGIMADSAAENEWTETQMKAKTIGELLIYS